jgi:hypothetical protein
MEEENDSVSCFHITFLILIFVIVQITDVALGHSDRKELVCDIPQVISKAPSVQTTRREDEVENRVSFCSKSCSFHF